VRLLGAFVAETVEGAVVAVLTLAYSGAFYFALGILLFLIVVGAANRTALPSYFWPSIRNTSVAWTLWAAYRVEQELRPPGGASDYFHRLALLFATLFAFYVVISLLVLVIRSFWKPSIPFLRSRPYPILIVSVLIPLLLASFLSVPELIEYYSLAEEERGRHLFIFLWAIPPWSLLFGALVLFSVTAVSHSEAASIAKWRHSIAEFLKKFATGEGSPYEPVPARDLSSASNVQPAPSPNPLSAPPRPGAPFTASEVPPSAGASEVPLQLKLRRTQRTGTWGKVIFALDARIALTAEHQELVYKYRLGDIIVYDSDDRMRHAEATQAHLDMTRGGASVFDTPGKQFMGAMGTFWRLGRASVSAARMALSLRITINGLIAGVHIECKDLDELMGAEAAIVEACQSVKGYIQTALTFDGREEIIGI
jgi:hypothetical protein